MMIIFIIIIRYTVIMIWLSLLVLYDKMNIAGWQRKYDLHFSTTQWRGGSHCYMMCTAGWFDDDDDDFVPDNAINDNLQRGGKKYSFKKSL